MRVLVTGGAGFIGSHIVDDLIERGDSVLVVDDLSTGKEQHVPAAADLVRMDIGDLGLSRLAVRFQPDAVVHAAAQASVAISMTNPRFDATTNVLGGINVIQAAAEAEARQFVYVTTGGALYGIPRLLPIPESHPVRPISAYGQSKWALEGYLDVLMSDTVQRKVLRLANVYGPRQDPLGEAGVVAIFCSRMAHGQPVTIHGDGEQTRDFVYVGDVARAAVLSLNTPASLTVNISSGTGTSINELFRLIASGCGYECPATHSPPRPGDVRHSVLDNSRARDLIGWQPRTILVDGLRSTRDGLRLEDVPCRGNAPRQIRAQPALAPRE